MDLNQNYFEVLGLPVDFNIDLEELGDRYRDMQKNLHPDKFVDSTDHEKRLSMQWTTLVNSAYGTLKEPLKRALYMLEMRGVAIADNPSLSPEFLMGQIELREELEEIEAHPSGIEQLEEFKGRVTTVMQSLQSDFVLAINDNLELAREAAYKLQFMNKLLTAADHLEEKLLGY